MKGSSYNLFCVYLNAVNSLNLQAPDTVHRYHINGVLRYRKNIVLKNDCMPVSCHFPEVSAL